MDKETRLKELSQIAPLAQEKLLRDRLENIRILASTYDSGLWGAALAALKEIEKIASEE